MARPRGGILGAMSRLVTAMVVGALLAVAPAAAAAPLEGYDGSNPFDCELQQVGYGTEFPRPDADPFCVEYDKRNQNVTQLGVVEFLSKEPARVAAASNKCFYYQRDHWRGSFVQEDGRTRTYEWDGSYYFDKAKGTGGTYVENFSFNGQTGDPREVPGFPEEYRPFFGPGRGGVGASDSVPVEQRCVEKAARDDPRRRPGSRCRVPGGRVVRGIGGIRLGLRRADVRRALGPPGGESRRWISYCLEGGGRLVAVFGGVGDRARTALVLTDAPPFDVRGIRAGTSGRVARRRLRRERSAGRIGNVRVLTVRERRRRLLLGISANRVTFLAVTSRRTSARRAVRYLRQVR